MSFGRCRRARSSVSGESQNAPSRMLCVDSAQRADGCVGRSDNAQTCPESGQAASPNRGAICGESFIVICRRAARSGRNWPYFSLTGGNVTRLRCFPLIGRPTMNSLAAIGQGLFWAAAIGIVAFSYGFYGVASGWLGLWTLVVLAAASVGVLGLFRGCSKGIAGVNYQLCILAIWFGHLNGTMALDGALDIGWFCISFLWPWLFFAVVGGIIAFVSSRKTDCPSRRTTPVAAGVLLAAAGLVACGFAQLRFSQEQPVVMFRAVRFFLQGIAFSPDGKSLVTVGGIRGLDKDMRIWDATTGRALGECEKERANNGMEKAAVQCFGNPPVLAASSYLSAFPRSDNKIIIQIWDLATQEPKQRFQWDDSLEIKSIRVFARRPMVCLFQWASPGVRFAVRTSSR